MERLTPNNWTHYLYIIRFVDGCFYTGVSKRKGDDPLADGYFGSSTSKKHVEKWSSVKYTKELVAYLWCQSHAEAYEIETKWQKSTYSVNDSFCLNERFGSTNFSEDTTKQGGKTQGRRNVENGTGMFRPDIVARRNAGEFGKSKPNPNQVRAMQEKGWASTRKQVVLVHIETGTETTYESLQAAARAINGAASALCRVIKGDSKSHKGYRAYYIQG